MTTMDLLLTPFRLAYRGLYYLANSPRTLIMSYVGLILISATVYALVEPGGNFGDAIWWAVVTASTVGYGDTYPTTVAGRFLAGGLISVMVLLVIPLITAHFASKLIVDSDAFHHEEQEELKANLRRVRELTELLAAREGLVTPDSASPPPAPSDR